MTEDTREARTQAVRALEGEFSALITQMRRILSENAERVSPGMMPGAYKVFTTIVRRERISHYATEKGGDVRFVEGGTQCSGNDLNLVR